MKWVLLSIAVAASHYFVWRSGYKMGVNDLDRMAEHLQEATHQLEHMGFPVRFLDPESLSDLPAELRDAIECTGDDCPGCTFCLNHGTTTKGN